MAHQDHNQSGDDADWRTWFNAWRDAVAAGNGVWEATPWPGLTQAVWSSLAEQLDEDPEELGERLRQGVNEWRHTLHQELPSATWLTNAFLSLTRVPTPHAPGGSDTGSMPGMPWLGPMQHQQAKLEAAAQALESYQEALAAYLDELTEIAHRSVDALEQALVDDARVDRKDARAIFDLWCQLAEQSYEEQLKSDRYAEALSGLANRWSELKLALQPLIDDWLDTLGMPSRRQVDETQAALDRLRRQHKAETRALRERLAAVEARLAEPDTNPDGDRDEPAGN
jgi:hypothetical protein